MDKENKNQKFPGFARPTTTQVPDEIFDYLLPNLSGAELKVLLYICRRTFGFKRDRDRISLNQIASGITKKNGEVLDFGTGLSKRQVQRACSTLEDKNIILVERSKGENGVSDVNTYLLHFRGDNSDIGVGTKCPYGRDKGVMGVGTPVSTTTYSKQHTDNNVNVAKKRKTDLAEWKNIEQPAAKSNLIAEDILDQLGDAHSKKYYQLVARKIPERIIRTLLSEVKAGSAKNPAKVFTSAITNFVNEQFARSQKLSIEKYKTELANQLRVT